MTSGSGDAAGATHEDRTESIVGARPRQECGVVGIERLASQTLAGAVVEASAESGFAPGDAVAVNGWGLAVNDNGGYATKA